MSLTDDQRAMLRLLAQNDESYEDIAALKGVSVEQVRSEVKAALAAAAAAEQETSAPPSPPAEAPEPPDPPKKPAAQPLPETPAVAPPPSPAKPAAGLRRPPAAERKRLLIFAGAGLAAVAIVLILIAVIGGSSGGSASPTTAESGSAETASSANPKLTQAKLEPVGGGEAEGQAVFGRLKKKIILLVEAVGLEPNPQGTSYTIWLYKSPKLALRVGSIKVTKSGGLRAPFQLTPEIFAAVLSRVFDQIYVSRTNDAAYRRQVEQAEGQKKLPPYSGETVLRGEITGPVVKRSAGEGK